MPVGVLRPGVSSLVVFVVLVRALRPILSEERGKLWYQILVVWPPGAGLLIQVPP